MLLFVDKRALVRLWLYSCVGFDLDLNPGLVDYDSFCLPSFYGSAAVEPAFEKRAVILDGFILKPSF